MNNGINSIASGAFNGVAGVTSLYVAFARVFVRGGMGCSLVLTRACCRFLSGNEITSIDSGAFAGLSSVTTLYVAINRVLMREICCAFVVT